MAAAIITLILLHKVAKRVALREVPPKPNKVIGGAAPAEELPPESLKRSGGTPSAGEPAGPPTQRPGGTPTGKPGGSPPKPSGPPPGKPPLPPPQSNPAFTWPGHRTAAEAEEALARTIHNLPDEVVVRWGDPIGSHGADVISVSTKTGQVTLWDSRYRSGSVRIQPSETFQQQPRLDNAIAEATRTIEANTTLPAEVRDAALRNLRKRQVTTRTVVQEMPGIQR